jgi:hypothetical protein
MPTYHVEADSPADYQYDRENLRAFLGPLKNYIHIFGPALKYYIKVVVPVLKKLAHEFVAHICQLCKQRGGK